MSPVILIPVAAIVMDILAAAELIITLAVVNLYMASVVYGQMEEPQATKVQEDIEKRLENFFGPKDVLQKLPVRNDLVIPGESGNGEIVPLKVALRRSITNSSVNVWLQDPLRPTDFGHTILHLFPAMIRSPSVGDIQPVHDPNYNPFTAGRSPAPPSGDPSSSGQATPTFPELPFIDPPTPYCRPWPPMGPFFDPEGGAGGAGAAVPAMCVAVGGPDTKRQDALEGVAGRVVKHPMVTVYAKQLPDVAAGSESCGISTRGFLTNNTRFTLIMRKADDRRAAYANHGYALANSVVCFPGQTIQIGGQSSGAGVEVAFRFQIWDIPYVADHTTLSSDLSAVVKAIDDDERGLGSFVVKEEASTMVGHLYCFIDIPKVGSSKINCFEAGADDVKDLSQIQGVAGEWKLLSGSDHSFAGNNVSGTFKVDYGAHPRAEFNLRNSV